MTSYCRKDERTQLMVENFYKNNDMCNSSNIFKLGLDLKKELNKEVIMLPFDSVLTSECMGAKVKVSKMHMIKEASYKSIEEIMEVDLIDTNRLNENLEAGKKLEKQNIDIIFKLTMPFTVFTELYDMKEVFKLARKNYERFEFVMNKISDAILEIAYKIKQSRINRISVADTVGDISLIGDKKFLELSGRFAKDLIEKLSYMGFNIHVCPKLMKALERFELLKFEKIDCGDLNYSSKFVELTKGKSGRVMGAGCL